MSGSRKHTEQFDRMMKIVQLIEMGGLKGVAKRGLREKTSSGTEKQGWSMARVKAGVFPSDLLMPIC